MQYIFKIKIIYKYKIIYVKVTIWPYGWEHLKIKENVSKQLKLGFSGWNTRRWLHILIIMIIEFQSQENKAKWAKGKFYKLREFIHSFSKTISKCWLVLVLGNTKVKRNKPHQVNRISDSRKIIFWHRVATNGSRKYTVLYVKFRSICGLKVVIYHYSFSCLKSYKGILFHKPL